MNESRDKFLTEWMGQCWHEYRTILDNSFNGYHNECEKCGHDSGEFKYYPSYDDWTGFGILLQAVKKDEDIDKFCIQTWGVHIRGLPFDMIDPDTFATKLATFKGWKEDE